MIGIPMSEVSLKQFRFWMMLLPLFTSFIYFSILFYVYRLAADEIKGVF